MAPLLRALTLALGLAAALAACSIEATTFTPLTPAAEDCAATGDEDGNGLADCADPTCAGEPACQPAARCGDGILTAGEACDDGNAQNGDGCDSNCTRTTCGNGVLTAGEACDDGNAQSGDGCDSNCTVTACGNGVLTAGEACDDGNTTTEACAYGQMSCQVCSASCQVAAGATAYCGDGATTTPFESCDDGNTTTEACAYGQMSCQVCSASCQVVAGATAYCGDGATNAPFEICDDGNTTNGDGCDSNCTIPECGNGVVSGAEVCDDGNTTSGDGCDSNCTVTACGNGVVTTGEACDDGNATTEACAYGQTSCQVCSASCQVVAGATAYCGDRAVNLPSENCDDGNTTTETCTYGAPSCTVCDATCHAAAGATAYCGDGTTTTPFEGCDDGNTITEACTYGQTSCQVCSASCQVVAGATAYCGDRVVNVPSENCDDGNAITEVCTYGVPSCTVCDATCHAAPGATAYCGDGVTTAPFESCDDGNTIPGDGCEIDCTVTPPATSYIKASNTGAGDQFGFSMALSADGSTLAVGAISEDSAARGMNGNQADNSATSAGAVYVYVRSGASWSFQAYIKASNTDAGDQFGASVALSADGSTLAVGARVEASAATGIDGNQADNSASNAGAVYVFTRSGTTWTQQAYVKASNTGGADLFGNSVALSADGATLAVGAYGEDSAATGVNGNQADNSASDAGAVYVFTRSGTTWAQQAYVKASNAGAADQFGSNVALSGDGATLAVGATGEDSAATGIGGNEADNAASAAGAVYVFARSGTTWTQQAYVKASNTGAADQFGYPVKLSGDGATLAVGAATEDSAATGIGGNQADNSAASAGAVYVFTRSGTTWAQQAYVKASNTAAADQFGISVALSSDGRTLAVGAIGEDSAASGVGGNQADNSASAAGAAYVFSWSGTSWSQRTYVKAVNPDIGDQFGFNVALTSNGSTLAVSAYIEDGAGTGVGADPASNAAADSGAVYTYR